MFARLALRTAALKKSSVVTTQVRYGLFDRFSPFQNKNPPPEVTVEQYQLLSNVFHVVLDVRELDERENGQHIPDDFHLPLGQLTAKMEEISVQMKGCIVLCYCKAGMRSNMAAKVLRDIGVEAWNLKGGYSAYTKFKEAEANGTLEYTQTREDAADHVRLQAQVGHKMDMLNNIRK